MEGFVLRTGTKFLLLNNKVYKMAHFRYCSKRARLWAYGFENDHNGCGTALVEGAWHPERVAGAAVCGGEGTGVGPWRGESIVGADRDVAPDDLQRGGATAAQGGSC